MSQSQPARGFTPFCRHDFYDKTYLQRLRNDILRLDNADFASKSSHPILLKINAGMGAAAKYEVSQPSIPSINVYAVNDLLPPEIQDHAFLHHGSTTLRSRSRDRSPRYDLRDSLSPSRATNRHLSPHRPSDRRSSSHRRVIGSKSLSRYGHRSKSPQVQNQLSQHISNGHPPHVNDSYPSSTERTSATHAFQTPSPQGEKKGFSQGDASPSYRATLSPHSPQMNGSRSPQPSGRRTPHIRDQHSPNFGRKSTINRWKSPNINRSRSPNISRSKSPNISRSKSPSISRSKSPNINRSKSSNISRSKSPNISRSKSPNIKGAKSLNINRSKSPCINRSQSHNINRSKSPNINRSKSPNINRSKSPNISGSKSPIISRSKSPNISRSKSPNTKGSNSLKINRSKSPNISRSKTPNISRSKSPNIRRSKSPNISRSKTPNINRSKSPNINRSKSPNINRSKSPLYKNKMSLHVPGGNPPRASGSRSPNLKGSASPNIDRSRSPNLGRGENIRRRYSTNSIGNSLVQLPSIELSSPRANQGSDENRENPTPKTSLPKRSSFPKIGMSELPFIHVSKSIVSPQPSIPNGDNSNLQQKPSAITNTGRLSRRDQYLHNLTMAPYHQDNGGGSAVDPYERRVVSPSSISVYSMRSTTDSLLSATDELGGLYIRGEKLSPQCSPRGSPSNSPCRYVQSPYMMAGLSHASPNRGRSVSHSPQRASPSHYHHSISPTRSIERRVSPHRVSPANSMYSEGLVISPSHSPVRFIGGLGGRRGSDVSTYSFESDIPIHQYTNGSPHNICKPTPRRPSEPEVQYNTAIYTPISMAIPMHSPVVGSPSSQSVNTGGVVYLLNSPSPSPNRQPSLGKEIATQTPTEAHNNRSSKFTHKGKHGKKVSRHSKKSPAPSVAGRAISNSQPITTHEHKSVISVSKDSRSEVDAPSGDKNKRQKSVLVMKTVTTVTTNNSAEEADVSDPSTYTKESTVHINIDSNGNPTADAFDDNSDIAAEVEIAAVTSAVDDDVSTSKVITGSQPATLSSEPSSERRPSITGPIPEIRMICATPEDLTAESPTI